MKRCWFGAGLLVVLLIGGLLVTGRMTRDHEALSRCLHRAARAAEDGDWGRASEDLDKAQGDWQKNWHFSAAFADHEPMEEIDGLFAQAWVYLRRREPEALAAVCAQLAEMTRAMGEAHEPSWWNML